MGKDKLTTTTTKPSFPNIKQLTDFLQKQPNASAPL